MSGQWSNPEAVERALAYLRANHAGYAREALDARLREQGFVEGDIAEAWRRLEQETAAAPPLGADLRGRAAAILIVGYFLTWLVVTLIVERNTYAGWASGILAAVLLILGGISLMGISASGRLRRGVEGALVVVLAIPFLFLVIVAGICVAALGPSSA